jgi:hypothetical protein
VFGYIDVSVDIWWLFGGVVGLICLSTGAIVLAMC